MAVDRGEGQPIGVVGDECAGAIRGFAWHDVGGPNHDSSAWGLEEGTGPGQVGSDLSFEHSRGPVRIQAAVLATEGSSQRGALGRLRLRFDLAAEPRSD